MKIATASTLALTLAFLAAAPVRGEDFAKSETPRVQPEKVIHAGGRHDQKLHEASLRARANGRKIEEVSYHAGGRHDAGAHRAAMKAEARRASGQATR